MKLTKNKTRKAFTMIELIFVIVIMGIIGKFGTEFLAEAYRSFIYSSINNRLQANSATAVEFVSSRLQYRIKASTIARESNATFTLLSDYFNATAPVLEWIGSDIEGFRGNSGAIPNLPNWSGIIDINSTVTDLTKLHSPSTDTTKENTLIQILSDGTAGINDAAIYFVDPDAIPSSEGWGWDGNVITFDSQADVQIHPIKKSLANVTDLLPVTGAGFDNNFSGVLASEYYQMAWSAYAIGITGWDNLTKSGTLTLWSNYQPWKGEKYDDNGTATTIMQGVSSFRFIASGSLIKIQVCVKSDLITNKEYSICKEKTVF